MPNKNYLKGRSKEYACMRQLEKEGYMTFRQAGSHSPFDVIAFLVKDNLELPLVRAIQCKSAKYLNKKDVEELKKVYLPEIISKELWHFQSRREPQIHYILE